MSRLALAFACLAGFGSAAAVQAQGVIIHPLPRPWTRPVPQPQSEYRIKSLQIEARLKDQVAQVQVSQTFVNTGKTPMEVQFVFPLPYDGAVDQLTLMVDGKELPAELLPADKARRRYEDIVRQSKDPALLEWMGHGLFQTSVFPVPAGQERTVTLHYNQLLRKEQGVTDFLFPLSTAKYTSKPVEKLLLRVNIESSLPILNVYSPTHDVEVDSTNKKSSRVSFTQKNVTPTSDFRLFYDVNAKKLATSVLSYKPEAKEDGYFLLLTTPQIPDQEQPTAKTVLFVVDKSGSMSGEKMEQARGALRFVLNNLRQGDTFNIIAYDSSVQSFRPELENFNDETRKTALGYVEGLHAGGGTNIQEALATALRQLQDDRRPSYILFLTDGQPTVGERNETKIAAAAKAANKVRARILNFGVGYDVNSRLLDRLGRENFGASEYVRPNEDIEAHVSKVYNRIASPVMTDVKLSFHREGAKVEEGAIVNRIYPADSFDLFAGEQVVLVGRYRTGGAAKVVLEGTIGNEPHTYDFKSSLVKKSNDQSYAFVEKLWALRRIGEIIDELDLNGKNEELTKELVALSTKHGILTPYTSFLADETIRPTEVAGSVEFRANTADANRRLVQLGVAQGESGLSQRSAKQFYRNADRYAAPSAPAGASGYAEGVNGRAASGYGSVYQDAASDRLIVTDAVRQVGQQTLYKRGNIACTPATAELFSSTGGALTLELDKLGDKVRVIERFSPEYFELCQANTADENRLLSAQLDGEQLLLHLRGQNYLIQ